MVVKDFRETNWKPAFYAIFYAELRLIAIKHGYALSIHGSMGTDMDLIATPWAETLGSVDQMVSDMVECVGGCITTDHTAKAGEKPHGRMTYTIPIGNGAYLDLSVSPVA